MTPVLDRYSQLAYSIGDYIHRMVAKHTGYENSFSESLNRCFIIQGLGLFRELGEDCVKCHKMRKKFLDIVEGPVSDEALIIASPFYVSMCDPYGPCHVYVPGHAMKTRHKAVVEAKCYVLVSVCPITKLVNLQVIEGKLVENDLNDLPMGYSYARDSDNSPLLKLIFPNMLRIGRNNRRALEGPFKLPSDPTDLIKKVEEA